MWGGGSTQPLAQTHGVGGHGQTLLDEALKAGLQDQVLVGDGLLQDLLSGDRLQRLRRDQ